MLLMQWIIKIHYYCFSSVVPNFGNQAECVIRGYVSLASAGITDRRVANARTHCSITPQCSRQRRAMLNPDDRPMSIH